MPLPDDYKPEFESLQELMVELAEERSYEKLLTLIVNRFVEKRPHLALSRIWLIQRGDRCATCVMSEHCPNKSQCLHLVASAGRPEQRAGADWSRIEGKYSRIPIGHDVIGQIAATGAPVEVPNPETAPDWFTQMPLVRDEGVLGFSAQPLIYRQEVLGVLAIFVRVRIPKERTQRSWLRMFADQAASCIANARAFEEIDRLRSRLEDENRYLREQVREATAFEDIIGQSLPMEKLRQQIDLVAPTDASVLILGETGTGKELAAREIHRRSLRKDRHMIKVNCAAIPRELWESEFFGHVKGAFTSAINNRAGRFELADGGTLFLDEVGEIPLELQSRLLRVLQEGQFERVGSEVTQHVNVRIVSASNKDLKKEVQAGHFRRDLYYRLNVFPIEVAPVRDRAEDIPLLADYFMRQAAQKLNRPYCQLTEENLQELTAYSWPGNVRELQNVIERAMITARGHHMIFSLTGQRDGSTPPFSILDTPNEAPDLPRTRRVIPIAEIKALEKKSIVAALEQANWRIYGNGGAAELLGLKPTTLASRIKKLGLKRSLYAQD